MFCNACGKELQSGQQTCTACGQPVGVAPIPRSINRVAHHIQILGILWIVYSLFQLIGGIVLFVLAGTLFNPHSHIEGASGQIPGFVQSIVITVGILVALKAAVGIGTGAGLLQRQPWARIAAIVLGIIALLDIPLGTALGVYTLWTLLSPESQKEYEGMARK